MVGKSSPESVKAKTLARKEGLTLEQGLSGKYGGIARLRPRHVVRPTARTAVGQVPPQRQVLVDDLRRERRQVLVSVGVEERDDRRRAVLHVRGHVHVQHAFHVRLRFLVRRRDALRAEQPTLLAGVPLELERDVRGRDEVLADERAQDLQNRHGARAVVVGARGAEERQSVVQRVLVRGDDDDLLVFGLDAGVGRLNARDDGVLEERMRELLNGGRRCGVGGLQDLWVGVSVALLGVQRDALTASAWS